MKKFISLIGAVLFISSASAYDFQYTPWDANSPGGLDYVVAQSNVQRTFDGSVSYWNPVVNEQPAAVTLKFQFPNPTASAYLSTVVASFNFGSSYGSSSLWASKNGSDWVQLIDNPTRSGIDSYAWYSSTLPAPVLGGSELWVQARMQTSGWNIMAQFIRTGFQNAFDLGVNYSVVPEPSLPSLMLVGLTLVFGKFLAGKRHC